MLGRNVEIIVRIDDHGRITISNEIRARLGLKGLARMRVEGDKIVIEPIKDPLESIELLVVAGLHDVEARDLRRTTKEELRRRFEERWL